jgi:hypothetical protein
MVVDQAGNEIVDDATRSVYQTHDRKIDDFMEALLACMRDVPFPKPHSLPPGPERMRYAPLEREILTATSTLQRGWQRWKETRS